MINRLPPSLILYGIEGNCFVCGSELTPAVEKAAGKLIRRVIGEIANFSGYAENESPASSI